MIEIIKYGKRIVKCPTCNAVLSYEKDDVSRVQSGIMEYTATIVCPVCNNKVEVSK